MWALTTWDKAPEMLLRTRRQSIITPAAGGSGNNYVVTLDENLGVTDSVSPSVSGNITLTVGSGVFFNPNFDSFSTVNSMYDDHNTVGTIAVAFDSSVTRSGGASKSVRIDYSADEDEWTGTVDLQARGVSTGESTTLYTRKFMRFDSLWETHWPVGLKTSRYFTDRLGRSNYAYMSEKYIWQKYPPPTEDGDPNAQYVWGLNHACFNNDRVQQYTSGMLFGNGLPYIRSGRFYLFETFIQMNSADNVGDGKLHCRVDGVAVKTDNNVAFLASLRTDGAGGQPEFGSKWQSFWFGGNISVATNNNFPAGQQLKRYETDHYASTTADWAVFS